MWAISPDRQKLCRVGDFRRSDVTPSRLQVNHYSLQKVAAGENTMRTPWLVVLSWLCHRSVHATATPCSSSQASHRCSGAAVRAGEHVGWQPGRLSETHSWRGILGEAFILRAVSVGRVLSEESGSGSGSEESVNMPPVPPSPFSPLSSSPSPLPPPPPPPPSLGPVCLTASCQVAVWGAAAVWLLLGGVATWLVMRRRIKSKHATSCSERRINPTHTSETEITVYQLAEIELECQPFEQLEEEERCTFTNLADLANLSPRTA